MAGGVYSIQLSLVLQLLIYFFQNRHKNIHMKIATSDIRTKLAIVPVCLPVKIIIYPPLFLGEIPDGPMVAQHVTII